MHESSKLFSFDNHLDLYIYRLYIQIWLSMQKRKRCILLNSNDNKFLSVSPIILHI